MPKVFTLTMSVREVDFGDVMTMIADRAYDIGITSHHFAERPVFKAEDYADVNASVDAALNGEDAEPPRGPNPFKRERPARSKLIGDRGPTGRVLGQNLPAEETRLGKLTLGAVEVGKRITMSQLGRLFERNGFSSSSASPFGCKLVSVGVFEVVQGAAVRTWRRIK